MGLWHKPKDNRVKTESRTKTTTSSLKTISTQNNKRKALKTNLAILTTPKIYVDPFLHASSGHMNGNVTSKQ